MINTIITLDGPAGSGKSTVAKALAQALGFIYLDTGAMFRAIAWKVGPFGRNFDEEELSAVLNNFEFSFVSVNDEKILYFNGAPLGDHIRTEGIATLAAEYAQKKSVRDFLKKEQQRLGKDNLLVAEGRDMGTVVFPEAKFKFFLETNIKERVKRRKLQLEGMNQKVDEKELEEQITQRDLADSQRELSPLKAADDAKIIDTTKLGAEEITASMLKIINENK